jgi:LacI family gluconate utilization system Gnt-I transcriptional repressor
MSEQKKITSRRATLADVAARANVSEVTVSRVFRRPEMVSAELRRRVDEAVRDLAYVPNQIASALASSRTGQIGVVVPSLTNGVFNDYLRALHEVFVPAGLQVLVVNSHYMAGREEKAILTILGGFPEAIVLAGVDQTPLARGALAQAGIPVVQTMELTDDPIDVNIGLSQQDAGYAAARYLFSLGHRCVGHVSAPLDSRSRKRIEGYRQAVREFAAEEMIVAADEPSSVALGGSLLVDLVARWPSATAVFCGNDNLALGALFECQRRGIRVPGDLSIIGFNDLEVAACTFPALTTVATPRYGMAQKAAELILDRIRLGAAPPAARTIDLGFEIVERESTAAPGKGPGVRPS